MSSPVKLYLKEMHNNVGYFATWLPANTVKLGDFGVVEAAASAGSLALRVGNPNSTLARVHLKT